MAKRSTKENKSVYQLAREKENLTREEAEGKCRALTADRIAKIEGDRAVVHPEDVVLMAECYKAPNLCNYYCSHECAIGRDRVPEVKTKELAQIAVETLNALNKMSREKERLLEIVEDGTVRPDEREDFLTIKTTLDKIAVSVRTMQLWIDESVAQGKLPKDFLK